MKMIEIRNLVKAFGPRRALDEVSLSVDAGERVLLMGPNGAGKTTLLRILATLSRPTAGRVRIAGHALPQDGHRVRSSVGFLSHQSLLYGDLSARQNLRFYARMYQIPDPTTRIAELLQGVGLLNRQDDLVRSFSRGMQQRLAVARAILHRPRLLLLDEPYTGLDVAAAEVLTHLLDGLVGEGCTLVLATHHLGSEGRLADRVLVLAQGRVIDDAPLDAASLDDGEFRRRYRSLVVDRLGAENL